MEDLKKEFSIHLKDLLLIPNLITILRIISIVPAIYSLESGNVFFSFLWMFLLFLTDFIDGKIARAYNQTSLLGSILDPVADKLVVLALFGYFFYYKQVPAIYFALVLIRDILQLSAVPILLFWKKISFKVKPKFIPKLGTALNFIILSILIIGHILPEWKGHPTYRDWLLIGMYLISGVIEVYILVTFVPRFIEIYTGKHDTFE